MLLDWVLMYFIYKLEKKKIFEIFHAEVTWFINSTYMQNAIDLLSVYRKRTREV